MNRKHITLEWRKSRTEKDKGLYGLSEVTADTAHVWFNEGRYQGGEAIDTFFHEMAHIYFMFHGSKANGKREERLAKQMGQLAKVLLG